MMIILIHISPLKRTISLISYINIALQIWYRRQNMKQQRNRKLR
jgi:hypothetical protein